MVEDEIAILREENRRLTRDVARIAKELVATNDVESCLAAIRNLKVVHPSTGSSAAFQTLYHITSRDNLLSIRRDGLKCALGPRSEEDGFTRPAIHCFKDKFDVEEAIAGWVLDVFGHDGGFVILEFSAQGVQTAGENGPILLDDVPFGGISVFDECFCPEDMRPSPNSDGLVDVEEAMVWLRENGCWNWRDGSRLVVDIHDDNTVVHILHGGVYPWDIEAAIDARARREQSYFEASGYDPR